MVYLVLPIMIIASLFMVYKFMSAMGHDMTPGSVGVALIIGAILTPLFMAAFVPMLVVSIIGGLIYLINRMKENGEL